MGEPATLVESVTTPVVTAIPTPLAGEMEGKRGFDSGAAEKVGGEWRSSFGPSSAGAAFKVSGFSLTSIKRCRTAQRLGEENLDEFH